MIGHFEYIYSEPEVAIREEDPELRNEFGSVRRILVRSSGERVGASSSSQSLEMC